MKNYKFKVLQLQDLCEFIDRGKSIKYGVSNIQVVRSSHVKGFFEININRPYYISILHKFNYLLKQNDILINAVHSQGKVTLFNLFGNFVADASLIVARPKEAAINPVYLTYYLNSVITPEKIKVITKGSGKDSNLVLRLIKSLPIAVPDTELQNAIIETLDELYKKLKIKEKSKEDTENNKFDLIRELIEKYDVL